MMLFGKKGRGNPPHAWTDVPAYAWHDTPDIVLALAERWKSYQLRSVDPHIVDVDDMLGEGADAKDYYLKIGRSALHIVTEAMLAAGKRELRTVLDLPCGGGRVTRHLRAFFPEADLFVGDIDKRKEALVAEQFSAQRFEAPADFAGTGQPRFDLIFSGSLLTHFDMDMFERSLSYFIGLLNPGGIGIVTLHGRASVSRMMQPEARDLFKVGQEAFEEHFRKVKSRPKYNIDPEKAIASYLETGFGYYATPAWTAMYKQSYGGSYTSPAWIMGHIQSRADCIVLNYKEIAYGDHQDVICLMKL